MAALMASLRGPHGLIEVNSEYACRMKGRSCRERSETFAEDTTMEHSHMLTCLSGSYLIQLPVTKPVH